MKILKWIICYEPYKFYIQFKWHNSQWVFNHNTEYCKQLLVFSPKAERNLHARGGESSTLKKHDLSYWSTPQLLPKCGEREMEEKWLNVSDENGVKNQTSITSCRLYVANYCTLWMDTCHWCWKWTFWATFLKQIIWINS